MNKLTKPGTGSSNLSAKNSGLEKALLQSYKCFLIKMQNYIIEAKIFIVT